MPDSPQERKTGISVDQLSTINTQLRKGAWLPRSFTLSTLLTPGIVNPIALSSTASVFACSGVSSTSGGRTFAHAGSSVYIAMACFNAAIMDGQDFRAKTSRTTFNFDCC